jgi:hypothetical protein
MVGRILLLFLALGVAVFPRPAGGVVLLEQRISSAAKKQEPVSNNPTEVKMDLTGAWQWKTAKEPFWHSGWIPSCFESPQGEITFQREFSVPDSLRGWHFHLVIPQANYKVSVVVNGKFIESAAGSHLGLVLDLPSPVLKNRLPNVMELRVDNRLSATTTLPLFPQLYAPRNYGGILSDCYLWITPPCAIEGVVLHWPAENPAVGATAVVDISRVIATTAPSAPLSPLVCSGEIRDEEGRVIATACSLAISAEGPKSQQVTLEFAPFRPLKWYPDTTRLYDLNIRLATSQGSVHVFKKKVGFREFSISGNRFLLNGQEISLRGTQYIPEDVTAGAAISESLFETDVRRMKELGFNLLHAIPSPVPPELLDVCDRLGMLVFVGLPLEGIPADILERASYQAQCEYSLRRMVRRDRTHACIMAWGMGYDLDWKAPMTSEVIGNLTDELRSLDSRPVFLEAYRIADVAQYPADFYLLALMPWRREVPLDPEATTKPIILSRVGMLVTDAGRGPWRGSPSNQADFLLGQFDKMSQQTSYAGLLIFCYSDYRGQMPSLAQNDRSNPFVYSFGLVDLARHERVSFFKLRDLAQTGQSSPISQSASTESPRVEFPIAGLALIVLLSLEIRRNNVFKQNMKRVFLHAHGFFSDIHARRFLQTSQTFLLVLFQAVCWALLGSSLIYGLRYSYRFDYVLTHFLRWPGMKLHLLTLIWNPFVSIATLTLLCIVLFVLFATIIKLGALLFHARVTMGKAMTYLAWAGANFVFLSPLAVVFYQVVGMPEMLLPCILILSAFVGWYGLRLFNALRVAYGTGYLRLYFVALSGGGLVLLGIILFLQASIGTVSYWEFYWHVLAP